MSWTVSCEHENSQATQTTKANEPGKQPPRQCNALHDKKFELNNFLNYFKLSEKQSDVQDHIKELDECVKTIKEYLNDHPRANINTISKETNVAERDIFYLLKKRRLL